jgi:hypothetical protein
MNEIEIRLTQLENRGYKKSSDVLGEYHKRADLYSKKVRDGVYVVFSHYNKDKKEYLQGFDCWLSIFNSKPEIGKSKALSTDAIRLSFDFKGDWILLASKIEDVQSAIV